MRGAEAVQYPNSFIGKNIYQTTVSTGPKCFARRLALGLSTILASGIALPALAQTADIPPPPVRQAVDENGVDLATGKLQMSGQPISIGSNGVGMEFAAVRSPNGLYWRQPWQYAIYSGGSSGIIVSLGTHSLNFTFAGGVYTNQQSSGETLTAAGNVWTLTLRDGAIVVFDIGPASPGATIKYFKKGVLAVANNMQMPSGEKHIFKYKHFLGEDVLGPLSVLRLQSVSSSNGYLAKIDYASPNYDAVWSQMTKATLINSTVDYCDPLGDSCSSLTQTWPSLTYTDNAGTRTETDNLGRTTTYTSNSIKRPSSETNNLTAVTDGTGKVTSLTSDGVAWQYAWAAAYPNMTATVTNPDGSQKVYVTNTVTNLLTSARDELNRTTSYIYDSNGRLTSITYPEGNQLSYSYDARGNVTQSTAIAKPGSGLANIVTTANYDASCTNAKKCNKPNWTRDAATNQTDYTYDTTHGGLLTVTAPAAATGGVRPQTRYTYGTRQAYYKNSAGSIVASGQSHHVLTESSSCQTLASCANGADEVKTAIAYGPQTAGIANNLLPVAVTKASGNGSLSATSNFAYDAIGNRLTVDGPQPGSADTVRTRYDLTRQVVGVVGPDPDGAGSRVPVAQKITYNLDGQVTQTEIGTVTDQSDSAWSNFNSQQQAVTTYDANSRPVKSEQKAGGTSYAVVQTSYDTRGRINCTVQRMDPTQWGSQSDACAPQTSNTTTGPDRVSKNIYNVANEVVQVQVAVGTADQANEASGTYNANGTLATITDAESNRTTYEYDGFDRTAKIRYPNGTQGSQSSSTTDYEQLTYDAKGNVTQRRLRDGQLHNLSYDNLNRVTLKDLPGSEPDVTYGYDLLSRTTQVSQTGHALGFVYDAFGRNTQASGPLGNINYTYDNAGRRTTMQYPGATALTVNYDYDVTGKVTGIRENNATSGIGVLASYAYDNLGRRTSITRGNGTVTSYGFDPVTRLVSLTQDLAGTAADMTINGPASGGTAIEYNAASQIRGLTRSNDIYAWAGHYNINRNYSVNGLNQLAAAGATTLGYDARGNLTASGSSAYTYSSENLLTSGPSGATLNYDPALRLFKTVGGGLTTRYQYDGADLIAEYDGASSLMRRYVHGPGSDEPLVWYEGAGLTDRRWYHSDERGSVIAVTNAGGSSIATNRYDEYGIPGSTNLGRFSYTGQTWLPELGMYYYKARVYSPTLGRFMQTDPIGYGDGMNLYNYTGSDPINGTDPDGLRAEANTCSRTGSSSCSGSYATPSSRSPGASATDGDGNVINAVGQRLVSGTLPCSTCLPSAAGRWRWTSDGTAGGTDWQYLGSLSMFHGMDRIGGSVGLRGGDEEEGIVVSASRFLKDSPRKSLPPGGGNPTCIAARRMCVANSTRSGIVQASEQRDTIRRINLCITAQNMCQSQLNRKTWGFTFYPDGTIVFVYRWWASIWIKGPKRYN